LGDLGDRMSRDGKFRIEFVPSARRALLGLPRAAAQRIRMAIDALADAPRPHGSIKLAGGEGFLRIRVGDYRVVYLVRDRELIVLVVRIADRKDVYRGR
jgi:mRNA interferase RelE/StbE